MSAKRAKKKEKVVVAVSGGFDPVHVGHVRLFQRARALGDELVVILNNDNWLRKKKGYTFMSEKERKEIIEALAGVDRVVLTKHPRNTKDMSVSRELRGLKPSIFANGGDRNKVDAANPRSPLYKDINTCRELGIKIIYNVGRGGKVQSSSWLITKYEKLARMKSGKTKTGR